MDIDLPENLMKIVLGLNSRQLHALTNNHPPSNWITVKDG